MKKVALEEGWALLRGQFSSILLSHCIIKIWPDKRVVFGASGLTRGVDSLGVDNLVWIDKSGYLWCEWPYKRGGLS